MENNKDNVFKVLNAVNVKDKVKQKNGLTYLSWSSAWSAVKANYPDAEYVINTFMMPDGNERFWFDDGKTGWVSVEVIVGGISHEMVLPIMDFKNKSIPVDSITSTDANKSMMRCLVKACAMHGLALYIYEGEDLPADVVERDRLLIEIKTMIDKKVSMGEKCKATVKEMCCEAERKAFPDRTETEISGEYRNISDVDILETLLRKLKTIRK